MVGETDPDGRLIEKLEWRFTYTKTITRTKIYLPMAGMILTAALALPGTAQQQVPFKGTFQGSDTVTPPTLTQSITGTGTPSPPILRFHIP